MIGGLSFLKIKHLPLNSTKQLWISKFCSKDPLLQNYTLHLCLNIYVYLLCSLLEKGAVFEEQTEYDFYFFLLFFLAQILHQSQTSAIPLFW